MKKTTRRKRAARFQAELDAVAVGISRLLAEEMAHRERLNAVSWRDCKTGGCALIRLPSGTYRLVTAHNHKDHDGPRIMIRDYCTEMDLKRQCDELNGTMIWMIVVSPPEEDDASGYIPKEKVMVFCVYCREHLCPHLPPDMPVTFVNAEDPTLRHENTVRGVGRDIHDFLRGRAQ